MPGSQNLGRVAVIGAGIAGLAAARTLNDRGLAVQVFDRGERLGGRTAHRATGEHSFDHGAQYFTARDARFARCVEGWLKQGVVAPWKGHIVALGEGEGARTVSPLERYVGVPGMDAMAKHLARGLDVTSGCNVTGLSQTAATWSLDSDAGTLGPFDAVILAMPPEQAVRLSGPEAVGDAARRFKSLPCWCAMAAFDQPLPLDFDGVFVNSETIDWAARDSSKPGRPEGERWTIHATAAWSAQRLGQPPEEVARALLEDFFQSLDVLPRVPGHLKGHRWSFAKPANDSDMSCVWLAEYNIALCGDWCRNGRVEGAYLSGVAAAGRLAAASRETG